MATIYRFIVQQKSTAKGSGMKERTTSFGKKGSGSKKVSLFGGEKGGVEHNRYMRAINPLLNKATGGAWEKGMRIGRAGAGLIQVDSKTGKFAGLSGTAITIIIAFVIQSVLKLQARDRRIAQQQNNQNYKMLENGMGAIHGEYSIAVNYWNGAKTYNQNK